VTIKQLVQPTGERQLSQKGMPVYIVLSMDSSNAGRSQEAAGTTAPLIHLLICTVLPSFPVAELVAWSSGRTLVLADVLSLSCARLVADG